MDGILNINKPRGMTSFDVVACVRRIAGERRVGHAGTLDPAATGVLPVCLGRATRVIEFMMDSTKLYRAGVTLGTATDTYDATGRVTRHGDVSHIERADVEVALQRFRGMIDQKPPAFSAIKYRGQPLYRLARAGEEVELRSRRIMIHEITLLDWQRPRLVVDVTCGKGTYIRSLAHDLGNELGCGAHLDSLVRLRSGAWGLSDSVSLQEVEKAFASGNTGAVLQPFDSALAGLSRVVLADDQLTLVKNGRLVSLEGRDGPADGESAGDASVDVRLRAYSGDGRFVAILRYAEGDGMWRPEKVFA